MDKKVPISICVIIFFFIVYLGYSGDYLENFFVKNKRIPKIIYKTGPLPYNNLSLDIKDLFSKTLEMNPDFKLEYYDDKRCRLLIKNNFNYNVLHAYDNLIPGAYKADLFRYCVLYLYGGVYSDLTQVFYKPFNHYVDFEKDKLVLVDDDIVKICKISGIQINFMASYPKHPIFLQAIQEIVKNVNANYYGDCTLSPTGPVLFRKIYNKSGYKARIDLYQTHKNGPSRVVDNKTNSLFFKNKMSNHNMYINKNISNAYGILWRKRSIYHNHQST